MALGRRPLVALIKADPARNDPASAVLLVRSFGLFFLVLQQPQDRYQDCQGESREYDASISVVEFTSQEASVDVDSKEGQSHNSDSVLDNGYKDDKHAEEGSFPVRPEENIACQQAHNEKGQTGADPATLLRYFDGDIR